MTRELTQLTSGWVKEVGNFTDDYSLLTPEETGFSEIPFTAPEVEIIRGRDAESKFVDLATIDNPPGDAGEISIEFYGHSDTILDIEKYFIQGKPFYFQRLSFTTPPIDLRSLAKRLEHYEIAVPGGTLGAGRNRDGSGGLRENTLTGALSNSVVLNLNASLSALTTGVNQDGLSLYMFSDDIDRKTGYRGPDKVLYLGLDNSGAAAEIYYSVTGGSSWAVLATDPTPFSETAGINNLQGMILNETQLRLFASRETDAGAKAKFAYQNFTFGDEGTASGWTVITIAATSNGDFVTAMLKMKGASRIYLASAGDIYLSDDLGESDPGAAIFTGANALNQFYQDYDQNIWAVGASNTILAELANARGTFVARTGPSGGGAFTAIARAKDGIIYAGNGTSIFRNTNEARAAAGWTSLKDFGSNHTVKNIFCVNGSSQIVYAVVSDSSGADGDLWVSTNGGITWTEKTNVTNGGYTQAVISRQDSNLLYIAGLASGSAAQVHKLS